MLVSELNEERLDLGGNNELLRLSNHSLLPTFEVDLVEDNPFRGNELGEFANDDARKPTGISSLPRRSHDVQDSFIVTQTQLEFRYHPPVPGRRQQSGLSTTSPRARTD